MARREREPNAPLLYTPKGYLSPRLNHTLDSGRAEADAQKRGPVQEHTVVPGGFQGPAHPGDWEGLMLRGHFHKQLIYEPTPETPGHDRRQWDDWERTWYWVRFRIPGTDDWTWRRVQLWDPLEKPHYVESDDGGGWIEWPNDTTVIIYIDGDADYSFDQTDFSIPASGNIQVNGTDPYATATVRAESLYPSTTSGCAEPAIYETSVNKQNIYLADFAAGSKLYAEFPLSMPDGWDGGTFRFRFKAMVTSAPTVPNATNIWGAQMVAYGDRDTVDTAWGTAKEVTYTNTASESGKYMETDWTAAVTPAGTPAGGEDVQVRIYHDGVTATMDVTTRLRMVQIDFQRSAFSD